MPFLKTLNETVRTAVSEFKDALTGDGKPVSYYDEGFTAASLAAANDSISRDQKIADKMSSEYHAKQAAKVG